jgi:hypothetical protein
MWGFFAAVAAFAVTLKPRVLWITMAVSIILYIVSSYVISWRKKSETPS